MSFHPLTLNRLALTCTRAIPPADAPVHVYYGWLVLALPAPIRMQLPGLPLHPTLRKAPEPSNTDEIANPGSVLGGTAPSSP